jgi:hypothetical protein
MSGATFVLCIGGDADRRQALGDVVGPEPEIIGELVELRVELPEPQATDIPTGPRRAR